MFILIFELLKLNFFVGEFSASGDFWFGDDKSRTVSLGGDTSLTYSGARSPIQIQVVLDAA